MISFTVVGTPQPMGSTRAFIPKGWNRAVITSSNAKMKPWRQEIAAVATAAMQGETPYGPKIAIRLKAEFYFSKPKSASKKVLHKVTKPDTDKLLRSLGDSLSGIVYHDDSQIVEAVVSKNFGLPERVEVSIVPIYGTSDVEPIGMEKQ